MHPTVMVVIRENPMKTPRAVEALRIALGLGAGDNPLTVVLLDHAPSLLTDEIDDLVDVEILEKHLPLFKELQIPFVIAQGARSRFTLDPAFNVREASKTEIASLIASTHRVLAF